jgi:hypothetical protein
MQTGTGTETLKHCTVQLEFLDFLFVSCISTWSIIVFLSTSGRIEVFWHRRPACAGSLEFMFTRQFILPHYTGLFRRAHLLLLSRRQSLWNYFLSYNRTVTLKCEEVLIKHCFSVAAKNVDVSHKLFQCPTQIIITRSQIRISHKPQ